MKRRVMYLLAIAAVMSAILSCAGFELPPLPEPAPPRATATVTATSAPTASPTSMVAPTPSPTVKACVQKSSYVWTSSFDSSQSRWVNRVREGQRAFMAKYPEMFDDHFFKFDGSADGGPSQDVFFAGIIDYLTTRGLDACVDKVGGDLLVSAHTMETGKDGTRTEQFHPIEGWNIETQTGRLVQDAPFRGWYTPRYW